MNLDRVRLMALLRFLGGDDAVVRIVARHAGKLAVVSCYITPTVIGSRPILIDSGAQPDYTELAARITKRLAWPLPRSAPAA